MAWKDGYLNLGPNSNLYHISISPDVVNKFQDEDFVQTFGETVLAMGCPHNQTIRVHKVVLESGEEGLALSWGEVEAGSVDNELKSPPRKKMSKGSEDEICKGMSTLSPIKPIAPAIATNEDTSARKRLFDGNNNDGGEEECERFVDLASIPEKPIPLASKEGSRLFVIALVNTREAFKARNHGKALERLQADLEEKGVFASTVELAKKRRSLLDQYSKNKRAGTVTWENFKPLAVVAGDLDESALVGTKFATVGYSESPKDAVDYEQVVFPKVAQWTNDTTFALIEEYGIVKEEFDKPGRHSFLWSGISKRLFERNTEFKYSSTQCERKFHDLEAKYKNIEDDLAQSGAASGAIKWPFYEAMAEVKMGDVGVHPAITVAAGCAAETVGLTDTPRVGKGRPSYMKRLQKNRSPDVPPQRVSPNEPPQDETRLEELKKIRLAMERRNELLERSLKKNNNW